MMRFGKKAAVLTAAGALAAMTVTGCSGSINTDSVVATVGEGRYHTRTCQFLCKDDAGTV